MENNDDFLVKTFIISMISFLLLEALLPANMRQLAFLFLVLEATLLWVIGMTQSELGGVTTNVRLLATYVALSALLIDERQQKQGS